MLQSPSWRGGAQRRPWRKLNTPRFLVGKKRKSRKIFNFYQHLFKDFKKNSTGDTLSRLSAGTLPKRRIFALEFFAGSLIHYLYCTQVSY